LIQIKLGDCLGGKQVPPGGGRRCLRREPAHRRELAVVATARTVLQRTKEAMHWLSRLIKPNRLPRVKT
jgi:hypothetical protein